MCIRRLTHDAKMKEHIIVQTCYAEWLSICSGYCEFNAVVHVHCVEWNCHYFCRILACSCVACATILYGE